MKRIIKKNQVIITSLVIMIVVAGYLNFTADESAPISGSQAELSSNQAQAGEGDMLVDVDVAPEEDMAAVNEPGRVCRPRQRRAAAARRQQTVRTVQTVQTVRGRN